MNFPLKVRGKTEGEECPPLRVRLARTDQLNADGVTKLREHLGLRASTGAAVTGSSDS